MAGYGSAAYLRELSKDVRELTLREIKDVLLDKTNADYSKDFRNQVILKLASNVLPRINEITGDEGGALQIIIKRPNDTNEGDTTIPATGQSNLQSPEV